MMRAMLLTICSSSPHHRPVHCKRRCISTGDSFDTLVALGQWSSWGGISKAATAVHGIKTQTLDGMPKQHQAFAALLLWVYQHCRAAGGAVPVFVAHSARWVGGGRRRLKS